MFCSSHSNISGSRCLRRPNLTGRMMLYMSAVCPICGYTRMIDWLLWWLRWHLCVFKYYNQAILHLGQDRAFFLWMRGTAGAENMTTSRTPWPLTSRAAADNTHQRRGWTEDDGAIGQHDLAWSDLPGGHEAPTSRWSGGHVEWKLRRQHWVQLTIILTSHQLHPSLRSTLLRYHQNLNPITKHKTRLKHFIYGKHSKTWGQLGREIKRVSAVTETAAISEHSQAVPV